MGVETAEVYDATYAYESVPVVVTAIVRVFPGGIPGHGPVRFQFALGTGLVALPPQRTRDIGQPHGALPHMVEQFRQKPGSEAIEVLIGDMATAQLRRGQFLNWSTSWPTPS